MCSSRTVQLPELLSRDTSSGLSWRSRVEERDEGGGGRSEEVEEEERGERGEWDKPNESLRLIHSNASSLAKDWLDPLCLRSRVFDVELATITLSWVSLKRSDDCI